MRKKNITKQMIQEATINLVAENGLENFTTKKAASQIGISEGSIFNNYPNKTSLLVDCLYSIDSEIDEALKSVPFHLTSFTSYVHDLWYTYYHFLVKNGNKTKFYRQFRHSSYYTKEVIAGQDKSFHFFSDFLRNNESAFSIKSDIFWVFVIETTLNFAIRVVDHEIEENDKSTDAMYDLIIHGISGIYRPKFTYKDGF